MPFDLVDQLSAGSSAMLRVLRVKPGKDRKCLASISRGLSPVILRALASGREVTVTIICSIANSHPVYDHRKNLLIIIPTC